MAVTPSAILLDKDPMLDVVATFPLEFGGLIVLIALSAFFSGSETALFSLTREQLHRLEKHPSTVNDAILRLAGDPQGVLATVLFSNMVVNVLYFSICYTLSVSVAESFSTAEAAFVGVGTFMLLLIFAEVTPKGVAVRRPEAFAHVIALPLLLCLKGLGPVRHGLSILMRRAMAFFEPSADDLTLVSTDELKMLLEQSGKQGGLGRDTSRMIQEVMEIREIQLKDVMRPRVDVSAFDLNDPVDDFVALVRKHHHKRIPVYEDSIDNILGVVSPRDVLLESPPSLRRHIQPVSFVPETKTVESMLRDFRDEGKKLAIVVDEYGGMAGLISLEDIIEEIVGEIEDEFDTVREPVVMLNDRAWLVPADLSTRDWHELFSIDLDSPRFETVGGFVISLLARVPRKGDVVDYHGLRFTVESMRQRRIDRIRVESIDQAMEAADE